MTAARLLTCEVCADKMRERPAARRCPYCRAALCSVHSKISRSRDMRGRPERVCGRCGGHMSANEFKEIE